MWILIIQATPCHTTYSLHNYQAQGVFISDFISIIISIINYMIIWNTGNLNLSKDEMNIILDVMLKENFITMILITIQDFINFISYKCLNHLCNILSELILTSNHFLIQFVKCNGLEILDSFPQGIFGEPQLSHLDTNIELNPLNQLPYSFQQNISHPNDIKRYRDDSLINGLQISSQLARNSEQYYDLLTKVFTTQKLGSILTNENPIIRAKGCNLIGNLCR